MSKAVMQETEQKAHLQNTVKEALFALLRYETCGAEIPQGVQESFQKEEILKALYETSNAHDLAHLIADALLKQKWVARESNAGKAFAKQLQTAVFRYEQIRYELESVCTVLDDFKIPHMPLKGSVLRALYPQPWMRTSCDIDMYVQESELERATNALVEKLDYRVEKKTTHDMDMYAPSGVHLELHYDLIEDSVYPKFKKPLSQIWSKAVPVKDGSYTYKMADEDFYFYHVAHTAKHLRNGGCGVRSFIDLWYLEKSLPYDKEKLERLLTESGLTKFAQAARKLALVWFDGEEHDAVSSEMEAFVLKGGIYGAFENTLAVQVSKGRFSYFLSRVFPPYYKLKEQYPGLKKRPFLYPVYIVRRWFNLLFVRGRAKNSVKEFNLAMKKAKENRSTQLLKDLGLLDTDLKNKK